MEISIPLIGTVELQDKAEEKMISLAENAGYPKESNMLYRNEDFDLPAFPSKSIVFLLFV